MRLFCIEMTYFPRSRRVFLLSAMAVAARGSTRRVRLAGVEFDVIESGASSRSYVFLHGNETTAREVLLEHMRTARGKAHLVMGKDRYVRVRGLRLDPNRMFSREGAERNLRALQPNVPEARLGAVLDWLDEERPQLTASLMPPAGGLLVTLHNNMAGYSVETEIPISDSVWLPRRGERHEFFLATSQKDFDILWGSPYNAVLQRDAPTDDDGSLSRLCAARGVRYVTIEAYLGRAVEQREMLAWLELNLP